MPLLEEDYEWPSWDVFRDLINGDMANLNKEGIGARTQTEEVNFEAWADDGKFIPLPLTYGTPKRHTYTVIPLILTVHQFGLQ